MTTYAVLIPWIHTDEGKALLLEVRSQKVKQPGEVCFPGGRAEHGENAVDAAVRETCEELGIRPEDIEIQAEMDPLIMGDGRSVHPVTAILTIEDLSTLKLSEDEVAEVFLLPESWLADHKFVYYDLAATPDEELPDKLLNYLSHYGSYRKTGQTDYLEYEGHEIWGLTARIIKTIQSGA